jgi:TolB-like protein/DNA-binding winged helix-turn-helix (wHTH) protein/Tfp pilus assembly protein PilF
MKESVQERSLRFGVFEADLETGELRKRGVRIKLQEKPFLILTLLLNRPGEVVTREELRENLWPADTFVDFDRSLGTALGKLRQALGDSADNPRFIETLPRRGYRFISPVSSVVPLKPVLPFEAAPVGPAWIPRQHLISASVAIVLLSATAMGWFIWQRTWTREKLAGPVGMKSILVLPLANLSGDQQLEYFVDGMTDELITDLAKIGSMRIISRTSAMRFKGTKKSLSQIARELNVDDVVEGSVLRSGSRVRITAQLIDAAADRHLWAETYERELSDVLAVQGEITQAIASQVRASLRPEEKRDLAGMPRVMPDVHEDYLKGRYHLAKGSESEIGKGIELFQRAIEKDPAYALAYVGLADSYIAFTDFYLAPTETMPRAKAAALRALELDDRLAEAHTSLAVVRFLYDWDWNAAEKGFRRAIELSPSYTDGHIWFANFLAQMSRHNEAAEQMKQAEQLDPLSLNTLLNASWVFYLARQREQAARELKNALELEPELPVTHTSIWLGYFPKAELPTAFASLRKGLPRESASPLVLAALAGMDAANGNKAAAKRVLAQLNGISKRRYVCPYEMAAAHVATGEIQQAFRWLEEAYRQRSICVPDLKTDPRFDPVRADSAFKDLLRRVNFPP